MYKCQSLSFVLCSVYHCSKDVGTLSPSADVRINLPEDNCLILCLPLQNFQNTPLAVNIFGWYTRLCQHFWPQVNYKKVLVCDMWSPCFQQIAVVSE